MTWYLGFPVVCMCLGWLAWRWGAYYRSARRAQLAGSAPRWQPVELPSCPICGEEAPDGGCVPCQEALAEIIRERRGIPAAVTDEAS